MEKVSPIRQPARRKLLGGGAALVTGALSLGFLGKRLGQTEALPTAVAVPTVAVTAPPGAPIELRLYGRNWHVQGEGPRARWARPERGQGQVVFGELLDGPIDSAGAKVGEFYATCTCVNAPFGAGPFAAAFVEHHTLNLSDGTLTGMGTSQGEESTFAIVGGTGRYSGARGSYVARQLPVELGGDGTAELVVTITLDGTA
jgi:Allene oxide cyclase barrel like domain